jgi:hypothetical protein
MPEHGLSTLVPPRCLCVLAVALDSYKHGGLSLQDLARLEAKMEDLKIEAAEVAAKKLQLEVMRDTKPQTAAAAEDVYY